MEIFQATLRLEPKRRGVHLVTREILSQLPELSHIQRGTLHLFLQHTSAALSLNENADPDVRRDTEAFMRRLIPDGDPLFSHTLEGPDDMPAHLKSMLFGPQLTLPVTDGRPALGTWQGIYLVEARAHGGSRQIVATLTGVTR
ncbi:MAG: YjbQ family protein [Epsilonproteobacteria bacterium]|nr:YjbQ family protein [Campylobacterota bacterium]